MVRGIPAVHLVCLEGSGIDGVQGVGAHAALNAHTGLPAQGPGHILFFMEIVRALMDMAETVDRLSRQVGRGGAQILQLRIIDSVKGNTHHVEHRSLNLVITVDLFAVVIDVSPHLPKPFNVLFSCSHCITPFFC